MDRRVTVRDIAKKTGYHYSTVSLALRGEPRLPEPTREAICRAAQEMGYCPDPMVKALAVYRSATRPSTYQATLAWLVNDSQTSFHPDCKYPGYVRGAQQCAQDLGYKLEEFLLRAPGVTPARMGKILQSRGISGVLLPPQPSRRIRMRIPMDWGLFAAVRFGYTLAAPELHRVATHHARGAQMAVRKLHSMGYRRIGLCVHRMWDARSDGGWLAGYLAQIWSHPNASRIEPLAVEGWEESRIRDWITSNQLDAVIVDDSHFIDWIRDSLHFPIPLKLGAVSLDVKEGDMINSGIHQNDEEIGRSAVHLVVSLLQAHQYGVPAIVRNLIIEGTWMPGSTVRRVNAK